MEGPVLQRGAKWLAARIICAPALLMPYRIRMAYIRILSAAIHAPFQTFGRIARILLDQLAIEPAQELSASLPVDFKFPKGEPRSGSVAILYSGGTDSTCAAALMAQTYAEVHLLTFYEHATSSSPAPTKNIELLRARFPRTEFKAHIFSVDKILRRLSYERYWRNLLRYRWLVLSTCGFSSLSWHIRTIMYCMENGITHVADGLTRELMHFPGHMDGVVEEIRLLYREFGIIYENPVRDWPIPPDQQFIDKVIVNRHEDFFFGDQTRNEHRTTGRYLFESGIFPSQNVKGSSLDFSMQHECYPFSLYNILAFWGYLSFEPYSFFCEKMTEMMREKISLGKKILEERETRPAASPLSCA